MPLSTKKIFSPLRQNSMEIRLANSEDELAAAQALRYRVFYEEKGARADVETLTTQRDQDKFDQMCDHLLVLDHNLGEGNVAVVGTYRLLRRSQLKQGDTFYSADEYDLSTLLAIPGEIMELGRSCVDVQYRTRNTMQLLWQGIAAYVFLHQIELMFGCGSLPGTDLSALAPQLSYLHHNHLAPELMRVRALPKRYTNMNLLSAESLDARRCLAQLPPLIKGYLRLGGFVGDGAVLDHQFNTTDVCVIVKTDMVTGKYASHYERKFQSGDADSTAGDPE